MKLEGKIIVIEGTDGSGKQTQTKLLKESLETMGYDVYSISFPNYESSSSTLVKMYLNGEIKDAANEVSAEAASIFYAADRYITYKKEMEKEYKEGKKVILLDRYVGSNIIHQGSKKLKEVENLSVKEQEDVLSKFITWLADLEYNTLGIPKPDITFFLNVPIDYTIKLREKRANKFTGGERQDIHEADTNYLKTAYKAGMITSKLLDWKVIPCIENDQMRSIEEIHNDIVNYII